MTQNNPRFGVPKRPVPRFSPPTEALAKTAEQREAEADLNKFILLEGITINTIGGGNLELDNIVTARGIGKSGCLATSSTDSNYVLLYADYHGASKGGSLKRVSLDL